MYIESQVEEYFKYLISKKNSVIATAWMLPDSSGVIQGYGTIISFASEIRHIWEGVKLFKPTLHVALNQTGIDGRRTEHIQSVRCLCLDIDRAINQNEFTRIEQEFKPTLVVESSPGKYHFYIKIVPTIPFDTWKLYQLGLAQHFRGDKNLSQLTSLIRVPGFERITKDGTAFTPKIVPTGRKIEVLSDAGIIDRFPWIIDEGRTGEAELRKERKKLSELARQIWRKKGQAGDLAAQTPEAGRNTALYLSVASLLSEVDTKTSEDECLAYGFDINRSFKEPLCEAEARKTILSAYRKWTRILEERRSRMEVLLDGGKLDGGAAAGGNGNGKRPKSKKKSKLNKPIEEVNNVIEGINNPIEAAPLEAEPIEAEPLNAKHTISAIGGQACGEDAQVVEITEKLDTPINAAEGNSLDTDEPISDIPNSLPEASKKLARLIWEEDPERAVNMLTAAIATKHYVTPSIWFCDWWLKIGRYKLSGPVVFLKGINRWGGLVNYCVEVSREQYLGMCCHVFTEIAVRALKDPVLGALMHEIPKSSSLKGLSEACISTALMQKPSDRQPGSIIAMQNGWLDLERLVYETDLLAPIRYSHAVWFRFRKDTASRFIELEEKGWSLKVLVEHEAPEFSKYMEDWFPGDFGVVEVLMRWFGYCMTTDTSRQKFAFFYGPTRAGKGSICRTLCALVGDVNYSSSDYSALDGGFKAANMHDKLVIGIEEVEATQAQHNVRMAMLKKILGGEKLSVERKYVQAFEDQVVGKFVLQSNEAPVYQDKGSSLRARMVAIGFERSFEEHPSVEDPAIKILKSEADRLGTLCALMWAKSFQEAQEKPFECKTSRAMLVGYEQIVLGIDVVGTALKRYFSPSGLGKVKGQVVTELFEFILEQSEVEIAGRINVVIRRQMELCFPKCRYDKHLVFEEGDKRNIRGYQGIKINCDLILDDYPELEQQLENYVIKYPMLVRELGVLKDNSTIEI